MLLQFVLSGSVISETESDCVPSIGSTAVIEMTSYKKGMYPKTILSFPITDELPPEYDFTEGVVRINVNSYEVLKEGHKTD